VKKAFFALTLRVSVQSQNNIVMPTTSQDTCPREPVRLQNISMKVLAIYTF